MKISLQNKLRYRQERSPYKNNAQPLSKIIVAKVDYTSAKIGLCFKMLEPVVAIARVIAVKAAADLRSLLQPHHKNQLKT